MQRGNVTELLNLRFVLVLKQDAHLTKLRGIYVTIRYVFSLLLFFGSHNVSI